MKGLESSYTQKPLYQDYTSILNQVPELTRSFLIRQHANSLRVAADTSLDELYLDTGFSKASYQVNFAKSLAMDKAINTEGEVVKDYLVKEDSAYKEASY